MHSNEEISFTLSQTIQVDPLPLKIPNENVTRSFNFNSIYAESFTVTTHFSCNLIALLLYAMFISNKN